MTVNTSEKVPAPYLCLQNLQDNGAKHMHFLTEQVKIGQTR